MTRLIPVLLVAALLGGCDGEPERSVEWYRDHPQEMNAKLQECSEQAQLEAAAEGNCARARKAAIIIRPSGRQQLGRTGVDQD